MKIIFLSHTSRETPFRVGSHHLARETARLGHSVAHVASPVSPAHLLKAGTNAAVRRTRAAASGPTEAEGVLWVDPFSWTPRRCRDVEAASLRGLGSRSVERTMRQHGLLPADALLIDQPSMAGMWNVLPSTRVVYRPTDLYAGRRELAGQRRCLSVAAGVVTTSSRVLKGLGELQVPSLVINNGVDTEHFAGGVSRTQDRRGLVYVGAIDERFDWRWLSRVAASVGRNVPVDVFGPVTSRPECALPTNVRLAGPLAYELLPAVLAGYRVGLLPLVESDANAGRSPMKLFEYLACGLGVVASTGASVAEQADGELVAVKANPTEAAQWALAYDPAALSSKALERAGHQGWAGKAAELLQFVENL